MISEKELTRIRADAEKLLPDTCHILSAVRVPDGQGGYNENWGTASANVRCRIEANLSSGREQISGDSLAPFKQFIVTVPYGTNVTPANILRIGDRDYAVIAVDGGVSWAATVHLTVEARS